jgi:hypothetical protein
MTKASRWCIGTIIAAAGVAVSVISWFAVPYLNSRTAAKVATQPAAQQSPNVQQSQGAGGNGQQSVNTVNGSGNVTGNNTKGDHNSVGNGTVPPSTSAPPIPSKSTPKSNQKAATPKTSQQSTNLVTGDKNVTGNNTSGIGNAVGNGNASAPQGIAVAAGGSALNPSVTNNYGAISYGNLKARCVALAQGVDGLYHHRMDQYNKIPPQPPNPDTAQANEYMHRQYVWGESNLTEFDSKYFEKITTLQSDFAKMNFRDPQLDEWMQDVSTTNSLPNEMSRVLPAPEIQEIAESIQSLCNQVPSEQSQVKDTIEVEAKASDK